jgi:hypothetical protein
MIRKLVFLALLFTLPLAAQDAQLFIERIEVRNHRRVSPDVVIAESRLHELRAYSEAELRDAATRLSRLPFLLSVDFSLEKGSERGRHVLVLTINETKPFFFLIDAVGYIDDSPYSGIDYEDRPAATGEHLALGYRWFVGRRGAIHVGFSSVGADREFTSEYASFVAGYTQYDLFGTRAFATINLKRPVEGYGEGLVSPQLVLGVPVTPNQTITLEYDEARFKGEKRVLLGTELERRFGQRVVSARWSYNTTSDPFFPTRGTLLSVSPHYGWTDGVETDWLDAGPRDNVFHSRVYGAQARATRFHELTGRSSVWGDVRADWSRIERQDELNLNDDRSASSAGVGVGYAFSLWTPEERTYGDSRFEFSGRYTNHSKPEFEPVFFDFDQDTYQASAAWVRRSSWGTLRLGVGYAW